MSKGGYYQKNKQEMLNKQREYDLKNRDEINRKRREHYQKNKQEKMEKVKKYNQRPEVKEKIRIYNQRPEKKEKTRERERINRKNPQYKLYGNTSRSIRSSLKSQNLSKAGRKWEDLVGYTIQDLKKHLENLFTEGMTWDNQGRNGWHIDHIIPKSFFVYSSTDDVEFKYCWSLNNLQPLWEADNIEKSNKI